MEQQGFVERIIFRNEENTYTVFAMEQEDDDEGLVCVGYISDIQEGMSIRAQGEFVDHPVYQTQFKVESYEVQMPEDIVGMEYYLASGAIKGIGPVLAKNIVKKFKMDTFRIIEMEPERLAEIKGISERKAREIGVAFQEKQEMRQAMVFLAGYGIGANLAVKIYQEYGPNLYDIVKTNPYRIAEDIHGVGFKSADLIAQKVGIGVDSDFRIRAALLYTLLNANRLGHTYLPKQLLIRKTASLLYSDTQGYISEYEMTMEMEKIAEDIEGQLSALQLDRKLVVKTDEEEIIVYATTNYYMELNCARMLLDLQACYEEQEMQNEEEQYLKKLQTYEEQIESFEGILLDEQQLEAVRAAATKGVVVITGSPGTGKTTTINSIIKYFELLGMELLLAAPTGRAAKRMTEATGYQAQTIHRLLELNSNLDGETKVHFERNQENPLEADVVIIDEMSMVDINLMNSLVCAVAPGTKLILVGDVNQLPSVGPGNVLKDIIESKCFPVIYLHHIYRQGEKSDIIINAHKINRGEHFTMDNKSMDFFLLPRRTTADAIDEIGRLVKTKMPKYVKARPFDVQVLTPMRKGDAGVEVLNKELQDILNPKAPDKEELVRNDLIFREGDKVMQIKNNYKLEWVIYGGAGRFEKDSGVGVFNGDLGVIQTISHNNEQVTVLFDDEKEVVYSFSMMEELELAYATTIHKSQGSEYPAVVIPLFPGPRVLLTRNLLYTAVTRAKQCVVLVGYGNLVDDMIDNTDEQKRYSSLDRYLKELNQ